MSPDEEKISVFEIISDLEKQLDNLKEAFTDLAIRHELVQKALKVRPSGPGRSSR